MPVKQFNRPNRDKVLIYCKKSTTKPTRAMMAEQKRLVAAAAERDRHKHKHIQDTKQIDWVFWAALALVIIL